MASGHMANYADTIPQELVQELCPNEWAELTTLLAAHELELETLGKACKFDGSEEDEMRGDVSGLCENTAADEQLIQDILASWRRLQAAFAKATEVVLDDEGSPVTGLELFIGHHSQSDDGDCYDEVDGVFFAVGGLYQLTPAGTKFADRIERRFFVAYG